LIEQNSALTIKQYEHVYSHKAAQK